MFKHFSRLLIVFSLGLMLTACDKPAEHTEQSSSRDSSHKSNSQPVTSKAAYLAGYDQLSHAKAQYNFTADLKLEGVDVPELPPGIKINLNGAVDMSQQRFELLPKIKAGVFQINLPIALDLTEQSLMFDPSDIIATMQMLAPAATPLIERYSGKFVRLKLANLELADDERLMLDQSITTTTQVLEAALSALNAAYKELPDSNFQQHPLDGISQSGKITRAVSLNMNNETLHNLQAHTQNLFINNIKANTQLDPAFKTEFLESIDEQLSMDDSPLGEIHSILYLDDNNQIVRINDRIDIQNDEENILLDINMDISNHGQAVFQLDSNHGEIIDLDSNELEILKALFES